MLHWLLLSLMSRIKTFVLYLLGVVLLVFGNRKIFSDLWNTLFPKKPIDYNKDIEKGFSHENIEYDSIQGRFVNHAEYFEIVRYGDDVTDVMKQARSTTRIESDNAETASDSL